MVCGGVITKIPKTPFKVPEKVYRELVKRCGQKEADKICYSEKQNKR